MSAAVFAEPLSAPQAPFRGPALTRGPQGAVRPPTAPVCVRVDPPRPGRPTREASAAGPLSLPLPPGLPLSVRASSWDRARAWGLTAREIQVLEMVSLGYDTAGIARELWLSTHTVKTHVRRMCEPRGLPNRAALVAAAFRTGALARRPIEPGWTVRVAAGPREVLPGIAAGMTDRQIADRLYLTVGAVKSRVSDLLRALDATSREHAVRLAVEYGLVAKRRVTIGGVA